MKFERKKDSSTLQVCLLILLNINTLFRLKYKQKGICSKFQISAKNFIYHYIRIDYIVNLD
jgi:hypothetical protein